MAPFSETPEAIADDEDAVKAFERMKTNLARAVPGMNLDESEYRLGRTLTYDGEAEQFVDDDEANKMLTRDYRDPFVVPEEV
jgi:hypothetical protein